MAGVPVLGPVVFEAFEVPERISLGGRQRLAIHNLPGGGRVVDALGPEEAPMRWSGVFSGPHAAARVRTLERLRRSGAVLPLAWDGWRFTVVIQEFGAETASPWWIPYRIKLCVLREGDLVAAEPLPGVPSLAEAVALGAGPGLDGRVAVASAGLGSADLAEAFGAAGSLARLVTARFYLGNKV